MKKLFAVVLSAVLVLGLSSCSNKKETLTIHDAQFAEGRIVHQVVKLLVEDRTDLTVDIKDEMSPVNSFKDLTQGKSDIMNSYDGTLLTTFLKKDLVDVPEGMTTYDYANQLAKEEYGVELLDKMGHENTYAIAVRKDFAEEHDLHTISDLIPIASQVVFGAEHEFFSEEGSMKYSPFVDYYGLAFKDAKAIDLYLKYNAIESENIDVTVVYSTDGLNQKAGLVILEDDQNFFPDYNCAILVREDMFDRVATVAPNLREVLGEMEGLFDNEIMSSLTYEVDVNGRSVEEVTKEYLVKKGLLQG